LQEWRPAAGLQPDLTNIMYCASKRPLAQMKRTGDFISLLTISWANTGNLILSLCLTFPYFSAGTFLFCAMFFSFFFLFFFLLKFFIRRNSRTGPALSGYGGIVFQSLGFGEKEK
jgi:hypothetical protein